MSGIEVLAVLVLCALLCVPVVVAYRKAAELGGVWFWNPLWVPAAAYAFYFVIGPCCFALTDFGALMIGASARPHYINGWLAGIVGFSGLLAGFWWMALRNRRYAVRERYAFDARKIDQVRWFGFAAGMLGLLSWSLGGAEGIGGAFANYINQLEHCAVIYFVLTYHRNRQAPQRLFFSVFVPLAAWLAALVIIGFRGPILTGVIAFYFCYHLIEEKKPRVLLALGATVGLVALSGMFVMTRSYFSGVDLSKMAGAGWRDILFQGISDCVTFNALCSVIAYVPSVAGFSYFSMFWHTITFPIPRALYPGKGVAEYLYVIQDAIGFDASRESQGMAVPHVGEYYLAFGWPGVFVLSLLLGALCGVVWRWFLARRSNPLAVVTYGAFCGWTFETIHRGYLPSSAMKFVFMVVIPMLACRWAERSLRHSKVLPARNGSLPGRGPMTGTPARPR